LFYAQGVKANVLFFDKKPASETPWTKKLWIYDLRTNKHFTLKTNPLKPEDLDEFVQCYNPENRYQREPTWSDKNPDGRWRVYDYDELINRDKASLGYLLVERRKPRRVQLRLRSRRFKPFNMFKPFKSLKALRSQKIFAIPTCSPKIVEDLEAVLEQFREIAGELVLKRVNLRKGIEYGYAIPAVVSASEEQV
jgi:type I restriction enzyme M protein